jgi:hypothetical protein
LLRGHVAEADVPDFSLLLQFREHGQLRFDRAFLRAQRGPDAQIHNVHAFDAEVAQIIVQPLGQLLAGVRRDPGFVRAANRAQFADDDQIVRIRIERLLDNLIHHVRAVKIRSVDVIYAGGDRFAQHGDRFVGIGGWAEDSRAAQFHGAVAHAVHGECGVGKSESAAEVVRGFF